MDRFVMQPGRPKAANDLDKPGAETHSRATRVLSG